MQAIAPIGIGLSVLSGIMGAQGQSAAYRYAQSQAERRALAARTAADQTDAALRDQLVTTLGNIEAIRASANIDPTSPTGQAILEREREVSERQRRIQVGNLQAQGAQYESDAAFYGSAASSALGIGYLNAFGSGIKSLVGMRTTTTYG
jgi:hypothetical protein